MYGGYGLGAVFAVSLCLSVVAAPARADRVDDFRKLDSDYKVALQNFRDQRTPGKMTPAEHIAFYNRWPGFEYVPRFIALAEANPADVTAYQSCRWVFERTHNCGTADRHIFSADQRAWQIVAEHHAKPDRIPELCAEAAAYLGPAREVFLRGLVKQENLSKEHAGFATLALAELLFSKRDYLEFLERDRLRSSKGEFRQFATAQQAPEFHAYITESSATALKEESIDLFRTVCLKYSDVADQRAKRSTTLGKRAEQRLYALEHLATGAEAPDIVGTDLDGNPLRLVDCRGRVVVLSFWFTGCGPCMEMIPNERKLIEKFKDRPFTLLGICGDTDLETARKTAKEEKIDWPCWFDGGTSGHISRQYDVRGWPTFYLIDANGRIAIRGMDRGYLADDVSHLLDKIK